MNATTVDASTETFFDAAVKLGLLDRAAVRRCLATARRTGGDPTQVVLDRGLLTPAQVSRVRRVAAGRTPPASADVAWTGIVCGTLAAFAFAAFALFVAVLILFHPSSRHQEGAEATCLGVFLVAFIAGESALLVVAERRGWRLSRPAAPGWLIVAVGACVSGGATFAGMFVIMITLCIPRIGQMCTSSASASDPMTATLMNAVIGCLFGACFLPACYTAALPRPTSAAPCAPGAAPAVRLCAPPGVRRSTQRDP